MSQRDDLLLMLGLPPQASAHEIEFAYLERRASTERRLQKGDAQARVQLEQLDRIYGALESSGGLERPAGAYEQIPSPAPLTPIAPPAPGYYPQQASTPAAAEARAPAAPWESWAALLCGIGAVLLLCWMLVFYRNDLTKPSAEVLVLLGDPRCFLVFGLAIAAEMLAHSEIEAHKHAYYLARSSGQRVLSDSTRLQRARWGRRLGRLSAVAIIVVTFLMGVSFFRIFGQNG